MLLLFTLVAGTLTWSVEAAELRVPAGASIQALINANPGKTIRLGAAVYRINAPIVIKTDNTSLMGAATIVQTEPDANIIEIKAASGVTINGLTLMRPRSNAPTTHSGVYLKEAENFQLTDLTIFDNRSSGSAILVESSRNGRISSCDIINYKRIGVDDRTSNESYGYAFRAIVGDGIAIKDSTNLLIVGNQIIEKNIRSDAVTKEQQHLGELTRGRYPTKKGRYAPQQDYVSNWHQGSAILVTDPEVSSHILINENLIQNAAQGIDIHADHVTISSNVINHALIGVKIMHGARNVIVSSNNISHMDLWGIVMQPGTAAHAGKRDLSGRTQPPNVTRGNIIIGNVFSDFGYGHDYHNWKESTSRNVLQFEVGALDDAPPLRDILVIGNIVHDPGYDSQQATETPRYNYAVFVGPKVNVRSIVFLRNSFDPGAKGVSNITLH